MFTWLKKNKKTVIAYTVTIGVLIYLYACESQVRSLDGSRRLVTRVELQAELNTYLDKIDIRFASLDRQDKLREIILNNAMIVVQGQPFNPAGLITAVLTLYGVTQAAKNTTGAIKNVRAKRANNKSPTT